MEEQKQKRTYTKKLDVEKVLNQILVELRRQNERNSIENYILDWIDKKYAGRIISNLNTEWENMITTGRDPGKDEYEYMVRRALEIHRGEKKHGEEKTEDPVRDSSRRSA